MSKLELSAGYATMIIECDEDGKVTITLDDGYNFECKARWKMSLVEFANKLLLD